MERDFAYEREDVVKQIVSDYIELGNRFLKPPQVRLVLVSQSPEEKPLGARDVAVSTAVQCYASGVAQLKERRDEKSESIARSTLAAGHHTTRSHNYFTWQIIGATRSVIHDVFHAHPFYNSEQQSQRYVEARGGNYLVPAGLSPEKRQFFESAADFANQAYFKLLEKLKPVVTERMKAMYPEGSFKVEETAYRLDLKTAKICQEIARYVLPIGQFTTLYHTLGELQLLRLFRASQMRHFPDEARFVIGKMIAEAASYDSTLWKELEIPIREEKREIVRDAYIKSQKENFDRILGGKTSLLLNREGIDRNVLIMAARNAIAALPTEISDEEILRLLMSPSQNKLLADVYDVGMLDPLTSSLRQISLAFATKLSHTADSQRQRHRMTPGATPTVDMLYDGAPDYITPLVVRENSDLKAFYDDKMLKVFANVEKAIEMGIPREYALLLLPNALTVRVVESGDLFDFLHRWKQRLCYLAQEEIFFVSVEQVEQVREVLPEAVDMLLAPCGVRKLAGIRPRCPEGERWCGKPVFNWTIEKYKENRLI